MAFPDFDDAFPDLGLEEEEYHIADSSGRSFILELPVELLLEISQYCKFGDVYSLMRVNKILHAVSIQRFYTTLPLHLNRISPKNAEFSTFQEMLPSFTDRHSSILRGLFARQEHLDALRTLVICSMEYQDLDQQKQVKMLVYGILENAKSLKTLVLNSWYHVPLDERPKITLSNATFDSLTTLYFPYLCDRSSEMLKNMPRLTTLHIAYPCLPEVLNQIPARIGERITDLRCAWIFSDAINGPQVDCMTFSKSFVRLLPNLQTLAISYQVKLLDFYQYAKMTPEILEGYLIVLRGLRRLQELRLLHCEALGEDIRPPAEESELFFLGQFSPVCPSLRRLTFPVYDYSGTGVWHGTTWKRGRNHSGKGEEEKQVDPLDNLWSPDPTCTARWSWWFKEFHNAEEARNVMIRLWGKEKEIPRIDILGEGENRFLMQVS